MKPKILLVEDDPIHREQLRSKLIKWGFEVFLAGNEAEFGQLAFSVTPDLIILDIMLKDSNGAHVYDHLIQKGLDPKIPVIFLSELVDGDAESYAYPGRKYSLHHKSLNSDELLQEIQYLVDLPPSAS